MLNEVTMGMRLSLKCAAHGVADVPETTQWSLSVVGLMVENGVRVIKKKELQKGGGWLSRYRVLSWSL